MRLGFIPIFSMLALGLAAAQTKDDVRPEFAVSSVKPTNSPGRSAVGNRNGIGYGNNATLKMLIAVAYQVQPFQISGGPGWAGSDRFDVEGKADDPKTDYPQLRLMMQSLLADRFKLKLHRETKESPVFSLVVAKGGPKIKLSQDQTSPDASGPPASPKDGPGHGGVLMGPGLLIANAVALPVFAKVIAPEVDRLVVDKTNLPGRFDIRLRWTPAAQEPGGPPGDAPFIFTAIQEQMGLKLESDKGPVELLIIDSAEKPDKN